MWLRIDVRKIKLGWRCWSIVGLCQGWVLTFWNISVWWIEFQLGRYGQERSMRLVNEIGFFSLYFEDWKVYLVRVGRLG